MRRSWPKLDFQANQDVYDTLHAYLQLVGKLPTRLHPWINHGWHVALRVTPEGFVTRTLPAGGRSFTASFNARSSCVDFVCDNGTIQSVRLHGQSVARLKNELEQALAKLDLPAPLHGGPNEVVEAVPFSEDDRPRKWDEDAIIALHGAFLRVDRVFNAFRAAYSGKSSPSHLFWGSMDLAVTRFSGRVALKHPGGFPNLPDNVTREAYSHEVISAGFWPGGGGVDEAAFYAYAYPSPEGLADVAIRPDAAYWHSDLGEFVLPYAAVAGSPDPDAILLNFLKSTFETAAGLMDWPADMALDYAPIGHPPVR